MAQELNARVNVDFQQVQRSNVTVFQTLESSLYEFLNNTKFTGAKYAFEERIECNFNIILQSMAGTNQYSAQLQVQYGRPVFGSTYNSPVLNFDDPDFNFEYLEFDRLEFQENATNTNLVSVMVFYAYLIIGLDHDTFEQGTGKPFYEKAQNIVNVMQSDGRWPGWRDDGKGFRNRYWISEGLVNPASEGFFTCLYKYHRLGLDTMHEPINNKTAKEKIAEAIIELNAVHNKRPNSILLQIFFSAKSDEILGIFSGGEPINTVNLKNILPKVDPRNSGKYQAIGR